MPPLARSTASNPDQPDKPHGDVPHLTRRVFGLFRHYRGRVAALALLILASAAIGVVNPLLTKSVFDSALFPSGGPDLSLLYTLVGLMIVIAIVGGALGVFQTWVASVVGQSVMQDLRDSLYSHLQRMSPIGVETLDGCDFGAGDGTHRGDARPRRTPLDMDGAYAAHSDAASKLGPGEAKFIADHP